MSFRITVVNATLSPENPDLLDKETAVFLLLHLLGHVEIQVTMKLVKI